jgi:hypothetical protein
MESDRARNESRRRWLQAAVAAGVLLPGGVAALIGRALAQGAAKQGVQRLRGTVQVNGQPAKKGTPIAPGDTVTTGVKSYVTFVVGEDAFLLRGDSKLELSGGAALINVLRLVTGKLLSVYSKGPQREVRAATATIGIRGTGAYLEAGAERSYFCLCYGEGEIVPTAAPEQREALRTTHHEQPRFIYAAGRERVIERAPMINHRDAELILLESLVGRAPPFVDTDEYRSGIRY